MEREARTGGGREAPWLIRFVLGPSPRRTALRATVVAAVCYAIFGHVFMPVRLRGESMEPTYRDGSLTLVNLWSYQWQEPSRGDVVAIALAGRGVMYLKRVLALPGERVAFRQGVVLIDGELLDEPYVVQKGSWTRAEVSVEPDQLFVVGDNRSTSMAAHQHGLVARRRVVGGPLF